MSQVMVRVSTTATDADILSGTLLANAGPGRYTIWAVSTALDGTVSISAPKQQIASTENIQQATESAIKVNENTPWVIDIPDGGGVQPTISYVENTAGTAVFQIIHQPYG